MARIETNDKLIFDALKALGIQTERLKEVHIHILPDDAVTADCIYYTTLPPLFSIEEFKTIVKKYELRFVKKKKV